MDASIKSIIEQLSALPMPIDFNKIKELFAPYPQFAEPPLTQDITEEYVVQLTVIQQLADEGVKIKNRIIDLERHKQEEEQYTVQQKTLQAKLFSSNPDNLRQQIKTFSDEITQAYQALRTKNEVKEQVQSTGNLTKAQIAHIKLMQQTLQSSIILGELFTIKKKLLEQKNDLLFELYQLLEQQPLPAKEAAVILQQLQTFLNSEISTYQTLEQQLITLNEQFSNCISTKEIQQKISSTEQEIQRLVGEFKLVQQQMKDHSLSEEEKNRLEQQYHISTNDQGFMASYSANNLLNLVNPIAWANWATGMITDKKGYEAQQVLHHLSAEYLTLLEKRQQKQEQQNQLTEQLNVLQQIVRQTKNNPVEEEELIQKTYHVLKQYSWCKIPSNFSHPAPALNYVLLIIDNIPLVTGQIKQYEELTKQLASLIPIVNEAAVQGHLLPPIEELIESTRSEAFLTEKKRQLENCTACITQVTELLNKRIVADKQWQEIIDLKTQNGFLSIALQMKRELQKNGDFSSQIQNNEHQRAQLEKDIYDQIQKITTSFATKLSITTGKSESNGHSATVHSDSSQVSTMRHEEGTKTTTKASIASPPNVADQQQLANWHSKNLEQLTHHSKELTTWYLDLYSLVENAVQKIPYCYQYSHLIRDIFFELSRKDTVEVLHAYRRICPNPLSDSSRLLALKPNIPILESSFGEVQIEPFQKLYAHYEQLKSLYPVEATLLFQAMYSLFFIYQMKNNTPGIPLLIPRITEDPRYDCLKRHRGFLKVWELIEDFFRFIIGKIKGQQEHEYIKKPCFFSTRSFALIEQADLFIKNESSLIH